MTTVLLDSHVVQWWSAEPARLSRPAVRALDAADELAVSAITWFELGWLATHGRVTVAIPIRSWLTELGARLRTVSIGPAIADTAVSLPESFPGDPADRLIYATAIELGCRLVSKDERLRAHRHPRAVTVW